MLLQASGCDISAFQAYLEKSYIPMARRQLLEEAIKNIKISPSSPFPKMGKMDNQAFIQTMTPFVSSEPPIIVELRQKAKMLHKQHADRHAALYIEPDESRRLTLIIEMMTDIIPSLDAIYDSIREFQKTGALPPATSDEESTETNYATGLRDGVIKLQRLMNLKSRISKLDGKNGLIATEKDKVRRDKLQKELLDKTTESDALSLELNLRE